MTGVALVREQRAFELLRRPEVSYAAVAAAVCAVEAATVEARDGTSPMLQASASATMAADERLEAQVPLQIDVQAKYTGYIDRQHEEIERQRRNEETRLPASLDYSAVRGLSHEVRQKLEQHRPATLGQAARIPGLTPAAISILLIHLKRHSAQGAAVTAREGAAG
jgi:tRNA uridine 5-carboxymethylaminomethyl modification enzyme